jgi:hypothetical protein
MAQSGTNKILAANGGGYPVQNLGHQPGSLRGPKMRKKEEVDQKSAPPKTIVVEQWICFMLGVACMAFGAWGICMRPEQYALSEYITWLRLLYVPALRLTAIACLSMGVMLIRRGWSHL